MKNKIVTIFIIIICFILSILILLCNVCDGHLIPLDLDRFVNDPNYRTNYGEDQKFTTNRFKEWVNQWEFEYNYLDRPGEKGKNYDFREEKHFNFEYYPLYIKGMPTSGLINEGRDIISTQIYYEDNGIWFPTVLSTMILKEAKVTKMKVGDKTVMQSFAELHNEMQTLEFHGN